MVVEVEEKPQYRRVGWREGERKGLRPGKETNWRRKTLEMKKIRIIERS